MTDQTSEICELVNVCQGAFLCTAASCASQKVGHLHIPIEGRELQLSEPSTRAVGRDRLQQK